MSVRIPIFFAVFLLFSGCSSVECIDLLRTAVALTSAASCAGQTQHEGRLHQLRNELAEPAHFLSHCVTVKSREPEQHPAPLIALAPKSISRGLQLVGSAPTAAMHPEVVLNWNSPSIWQVKLN